MKALPFWFSPASADSIRHWYTPTGATSVCPFSLALATRTSHGTVVMMCSLLRLEAGEDLAHHLGDVGVFNGVGGESVLEVRTGDVVREIGRASGREGGEGGG